MNAIDMVGIGVMAGMLLGLLVGSLTSLFWEHKWLTKNVWIEVEPEFFHHALDTFKHVEGMTVYEFPAGLEQKADKKMAFVPERTLFYFRYFCVPLWLRDIWKKQHDGHTQSAEVWKRHLVEMIEKRDLKVVDSGVC